MNPETRSLRLLVWSAAFAAGALLILHLSPNTVDPDLWGHVMFGHRIIETGQVERVEPFSCTAHGAPWVNHEVLAEVAMAAAHRAMGGTGLLLLKIFVGLLAFAVAMRLGMGRGGPWQEFVAWCVGGIAAVEIGFGFACRPQIFTALALPVLLLLLRMAHERSVLWLAPVPPLFCLWFNTHGGALAGLALLALAAATTTAVAAFGARWARIATPSQKGIVPALWAALLLSTLAAAVNPWGVELPLWLARSVMWTRPEILEWTPTPLGWDHAVFFMLVTATAAAALASRAPLRAWEFAIVAALAFAAARHVRHTPLFAIAALAVIPPHAHGALLRLSRHAPALAALARNATARTGLALALCAAAAATLAVAWTKGKDNPLTMEIPTSQYPVDAVKFMKEDGSKGDLLVYFDWGEMCIWELPDCRVSIDGRLDTCYPRETIEGHWLLFSRTGGRDVAGPIENGADMALVPADMPGAQSLARSGEWRIVFADNTAVVFRKRNGTGSTKPRPEAPSSPRRIPFPDDLPSGLLRNHASGHGAL